MSVRPLSRKDMFPKIAFVNKATEPLEIELPILVAALAKQLEVDFVPIWGYPATLRVTDAPTPDEWQVIFLDDADAANALAYHDITLDGQPISKVFVRTIKAAGEKLSVTASHELLEMLIDPGAQIWAQGGNGVFYAYEMCDAVEGEEYSIDGVAVSDFVHPSFFESWHKPNSVQFDHLKRVSSPFQTLQRGYQIVSKGGRVTEVFGSRAKERHFRDVEERTMHRSEYRKWRALAAGGQRTRSADTGKPSGSRAAALDYAGRLLRQMAGGGDDPFDGSGLPRPRAPKPGDDPFCGYDLPCPEGDARPKLGIRPLRWDDEDDPFEGYHLPRSGR